MQPDRAPAQRWAGTAPATEIMRIVCVTIAHFAEDLRSTWRSAHPEKRYGSLADLRESMYCQTPTAQTTADARWVKFTAVMYAIWGLRILASNGPPTLITTTQALGPPPGRRAERSRRATVEASRCCRQLAINIRKSGLLLL